MHNNSEIVHRFLRNDITCNIIEYWLTQVTCKVVGNNEKFITKLPTFLKQINTQSREEQIKQVGAAMEAPN